MNNFMAFNPTRVHFGVEVVSELGNHAAMLGSHALLIYGKGSALKNGSYHDTLASLKKHNIKVTEYSGIKSNPVVDDVMEASAVGRRNGVDMVVAVGGASVIDTAKITALCIADNADAWELVMKKQPVQSAIPIITVLTLAATGTEMNQTTVLMNNHTKLKKGFKHELMYPTHSYMDPTYTLSVPRNYTAYGIVDLITHCLEAWFGESDTSLCDRFVLAIIQEALEFGPQLMDNLQDIKLRAKIMWAATNALNNMTSYGRTSPDWGVHVLAHTFSVLYDTPHGASLSIVYPAWLRVMSDRANDRIAALGEGLFGDPSVEKTISSLETFFANLGSPIRCRDAAIKPAGKAELLSLWNKNNAQGLNYHLSDEEREKILTFTFENQGSHSIGTSSS